VFEVMECLGGNGYVEEGIMPRLYREAPVNAIWEGSGNVMCLDVLRALKGEEERALFSSLARDAGVEDREPSAQAPSEALARITVERLALLATAAALRGSAPPIVADQFVRTRLARSHGALYGAQDIDPAAADVLLRRALPER
jgi:putative acyl-CoA dehydrogenase